MQRPDITIRPLAEHDLPAARGIFRLAFGTFLGVPDPENFAPDMDHVRIRWLADSASAFGAEAGGELVGSSFAARWGSVGVLGPLTVRPDMWDQGIGSRLMEPIMGLFKTWGITHAGLSTFAQSAKHIGLYQKHGFWPRFLTAVMSKTAQPNRHASQWSTYSQVPEGNREGLLADCRELTDAIYSGLDLEREVRAVSTQCLGDTVLFSDEGKLAGFAVCHVGPGTEAGKDRCYIKFGAVRGGSTAGARFGRLLGACEALAVARGTSKLTAGVNVARFGAYHMMLEHGWHTDVLAVAMHRPNAPGYNRSDVYLIDDWR
jgi:predicted N-acetyltransferase YhbS